MIELTSKSESLILGHIGEDANDRLVSWTVEGGAPKNMAFVLISLGLEILPML